MARILSIIDAFDAMISIRPYRGRRTIESTLELIGNERYLGQWDPELVGIFLKMMNQMSMKGYHYV